MATWTTKRCPYCKYSYVINAGGDQRRYGSPLVKCQCCGKQFWDTDIVEPALYGFENLHEDIELLKRWLAVIIGGSVSIGFLYLGYLFIISGDFDWILIFIFGFPMFIFYMLFSYFRRVRNDKKNKEEILEKHRIEYDESLKRLSNMEYVKALAEFDKKAEKLLNEYKNESKGTFAERP